MKLIKKEVVYLPIENNEFEHIVRYMPWFTNRVCINVMYGDIRVLHSHPWNYFTLMLWGGYDETVIIEDTRVVKRRYPGWFSFKKYSDYHRIEPIGKRAISLFIRGRERIKYTKFLVDGKEIRDIKYWKSIGCTREQIDNSIVIQ